MHAYIKIRVDPLGRVNSVRGVMEVALNRPKELNASGELSWPVAPVGTSRPVGSVVFSNLEKHDRFIYIYKCSLQLLYTAILILICHIISCLIKSQTADTITYIDLCDIHILYIRLLKWANPDGHLRFNPAMWIDLRKCFDAPGRKNQCDPTWLPSRNR